MVNRLKGLRSNLTYANVMSTIAVVFALGGGTAAIAASVGKNSVTSKSIKAGNVTARDLTSIRVATATGDPSFSNPVRATCKSKEKLVGGGAQLTDVNEPPPFDDFPTALSESRPDGNSWVASATFRGTATVYALCLNAKPGKG